MTLTVGEGEWERVKNKTGVAVATMERVAGALGEGFKGMLTKQG